MVAAATAPGINQKIINVGSGTETSVRDLVNLALEVTGGRPEVVYNPRNEGGVRRMRADLTQSEALLNYRPAVDLRTGLQMTFAKDKRLCQR
jgi:nucleoside-diphosphate-sugar epimerase